MKNRFSKEQLKEAANILFRSLYADDARIKFEAAKIILGVEFELPLVPDDE